MEKIQIMGEEPEDEDDITDMVFIFLPFFFHTVEEYDDEAEYNKGTFAE